MKKRIIKTIGFLSVVLMVGFSFNGKDAIADGGIDCDCGIFRGGCFANGWGANCAPEGEDVCRGYDLNCIKNQD